jgi:hypothetical protein
MNHKQSSVEIIPTDSRSGAILGHSTGVNASDSSPPGERDLMKVVAALRVRRRPGTYVYVSVTDPDAIEAAAMIEEAEGTTFVVTRDVAARERLPWSFAAAWLTIEVHTALDAVGVTALLATALADAGISCNVLAGYHHDHLLVPLERADDAIAVIDACRERVRRGDGGGASPG